MNYLDVYFSRINHNGQTVGERIRNCGIRSFQKWLKESPHTIHNLSIERGIYFDGIILTEKDKAYQKIMFLNVANDIPILVGDIMNWKLEDGTTEKWILFQEEKKVSGTHRTFWITRCNYLLKWVDADGHLQQSWSYVISSTDDKIKGNFRTWNNLITPQPNKYAEILMPRYSIDRATNFIIEEEAWTVVEYDHTSVPGVIYLSLTEGKINLIYDDIENGIADTDKIARYELLAPEEEQVFVIGQQINPIFTLTKNGSPIDTDVELIPENKNVAKFIDGVLTAVGEGETNIFVKLKNTSTVVNSLPIKVAEQREFSAYLNGADTIHLDRETQYELVGSVEISGEVVFFINNLELARIVKVENNTCVIHANDKNLLGSFILTATYDGKTYTKTITIIPLW